MSLKVSVIAAVGRRGQIARDGIIPWNSPDDRRDFVKETYGGVMIAGATTFLEMAHLHNEFIRTHRTLICFSRRSSWGANPSILLSTLDESLYENVWIVGGAKTYSTFARYINDKIAINVMPYDNDPSEDHRHTFFPLAEYGLTYEDLRTTKGVFV